MEYFVYIFAAILMAVGLLLVLHVKGALWQEPPADDAREQQWAAYEERRMRVRRDRVWSRVETLHSEFVKREAAAAPARAQAPTPRPEQGGNPGAITPREAGAAGEHLAAPPAAAGTARRLAAPARNSLEIK